MKLSEMQFGAALPVEGYGPGYFRVGGQLHHGPVLVTPTGVTLWAGLEDAAALLALKGEVDVVFLGMGADIAYPPKALREAMEAAEIGLEAMSSPAAARTYNVCLSEGRRVAAALLVV